MIAELVAGVQAYFDANSVAANVVGDFPERNKQINQGPGGAARVAIYYGDESGNCGELGPPHGQNDYEPRRLADDEKKFTLYVWAYDAANKDNRAAQVDAALALRDWTIRAFRTVAQGTGDLVWGGTRRTKDVERQFGVELAVSLVIRTHVDDAPATVVFPAPVINPDPPLS